LNSIASSPPISARPHKCAPAPIPDTDGARDLAVALVKQAVQDLRDWDPAIRGAARAWWHDAAAVGFWDDVLGLNGALLRYAAAVPVGAADGQGAVQLALF
jgi:hypothetical protein